MLARGVQISMVKFQSGFLKKHIIFPGCICFPDYKNIRVEFLTQGNESSGYLRLQWEFQWENDQKNKMAKNHFSGVQNGSQSV